jgi:urease accessory protein
VIFAAVCKGETDQTNALALALSSSAERHLETTSLGAAFKIAASVFVKADWPDSEDLAYPVAAATACHAMKIEPDQALLAFLQGFSNALISVAVRLVPIGQTAGLNIMRDLMPIIAETADRASRATLADLGSCAFMSDIAAMKHQTLQPRIFRT